MKVFLDSNIILDSLCHNRPFGPDAKRIMDEVAARRFKAYITAASFHTIIFYVEKDLRIEINDKAVRIERLKLILKSLLKLVTIASQDNKQLERAILNPEFHDLEDSCQYQAALKANCDYLVTINTKDFSDCTGKTAVLHPVDFVKVLDELEK